MTARNHSYSLLIACVGLAPGCATATREPPPPVAAASVQGPSAPIRRTPRSAVDHAWTAEEFVAFSQAVERKEVPPPRDGSELFAHISHVENLNLDAARDAMAVAAAAKPLLEAYLSEGLEGELHLMDAMLFRLSVALAGAVASTMATTKMRGPALAQGILVATELFRKTSESAAQMARLLELGPGRRATMGRFLDEVTPAFPAAFRVMGPRAAGLWIDGARAGIGAGGDLRPRYERLLAAMVPPPLFVLRPGILERDGKQTRWSTSHAVVPGGLPDEGYIDVAPDVAFGMLREVLRASCRAGLRRALLRFSGADASTPVEVEACPTTMPAIRLRLDPRGIAITTAADANVAPGCKTEGSGLAVPRVEGDTFDAYGLGGCVVALRARLEERGAVLGAPAAAPFMDVSSIAEIARGPLGTGFTSFGLSDP